MIDEAFSRIKGAFPSLAEFQGLHFKYAMKRDSEGRITGLLIEQKRGDRFFYWLAVGNGFKLVHASQVSRLKRMEPISDSTFIPSHAYDDDATA